MRWLLVIFILLLAGCGDKDGGSGYETPDKDGGFFVIHLTPERTFDPAKASVPAGALVAFRFELRDCDVRSDTTGGPDSRGQSYATGIYPEGGTYNWQAPSEAGEFDVYCSRHYDSGMRGTIRVG